MIGILIYVLVRDFCVSTYSGSSFIARLVLLIPNVCLAIPSLCDSAKMHDNKVY